MNSPKAIKPYRRTILSKNILKPFSGVINKNKGNKDKPKIENKKENKGKTKIR